MSIDIPKIRIEIDAEGDCDKIKNELLSRFSWPPYTKIDINVNDTPLWERDLGLSENNIYNIKFFRPNRFIKITSPWNDQFNEDLKNDLDVEIDGILHEIYNEP